jgi:hypothetical protein
MLSLVSFKNVYLVLEEFFLKLIRASCVTDVTVHCVPDIYL